MASLLVAMATVIAVMLTPRPAPAADAEKLKFEVYQDAGKEFRWRLKSANGKVLATPGQGYTAKADCMHAIDVIKSDAADKLKFESYQDDKGEHRWRLKAGNGQVIASSSEGYANAADCEHAIDVVKQNVKDAAVAEM